MISQVEKDKQLFKIAKLAVGGALLSSELALAGESSFALIRPPGHHASPDSNWGFCYFNNMAITIKKLLREKRLDEALIIDIDLHFGDGTANSFEGFENLTYYHPEASSSNAFINKIRKIPSRLKRYGILGVSAGFDRGVRDWGGMLTDSDYNKIGVVLKEVSEKLCEGKRFASLEGGYNHSTLGQTIKSFLKGFE